MRFSKQKKLRKILSKAYDDAHYATVVVVARKLLEMSPKDSYILMIFGHSLTRMGRYSEGIQALKESLNYIKYEGMPVIYFRLGQLYRDLYQLEKSRYWYQRAIDAMPYDTTGYIFMGTIFAVEGKLDEAIKMFRRAIACEEGYIDEAYLNLGLALRTQEKLDEARDCFMKAIEIDSGYKSAKIALEDVENALAINGSLDA